MALVLALEPDPKQAAVLKQVVRDRVGAAFVLADSKDAALAAIAERVPDLILVTTLLSPRDEADLTGRLRGLEGAEHLQTLTIPLLALGPTPQPKKKRRGLLSALTGEPERPTAPEGCDPAVFAEEIRNYIARAEELKADATAGRKRVRDAKQITRRKRTAQVETMSAALPADILVAAPMVEALGVPAVADGVGPQGSYWAWEPKASEETTAAPAEETPEPQPDPTPPASGASSWANPWDVSRSAARATLEGLARKPTYLDDHELPPLESLPPVITESAAEALLDRPVQPTAAEQLADRSATPDEEIDLSSLLGTPAEQTPREPGPGTETFYTLSFDAIDLNALLNDAPAINMHSPHVEAAAAHIVSDADREALISLKADVDRLRADREAVETSLIEARAAQERAEASAAEAGARAREGAERHAQELVDRARDDAAAEHNAREREERNAREREERRAREEAERRAEAEHTAREEYERLLREVEARMRAEAEAERRLREEAERAVRDAEVARVREAANRREREETDREARERAEEEAASERRAREQAEARADAERQAREAAEQMIKQEAERLARETDDRVAREAAELRAREAKERKAREEAERRAEMERRTHEDAEKIAEQAAAGARNEARAERKARELAERRAAEERKARELAERRAREEATKRAAAEARERQEAERHAQDQAARPARKATIISKGKRRAEPEPVRPRKDRDKDPRPTQDEWGLYDPDKCGFGALYAKLEAIEDGEPPEEEPTAGNLPANVESSSGGHPRPLSMWVWRCDLAADGPAPCANVPPDDLRGLVDRLRIPAAVAGVTYASGARIGRVKVTPERRKVKPRDEDTPILILSRKLLKAVRAESAQKVA